MRAAVVVDASAVLALLLDPGERGQSVARRLGGTDVVAPHLMPFEVANVLRRRRASGLMSATDADLAHDALLELPVRLWPYAHLAPAIWRLTGALTAYDASYVALAEHLAAPLLTADARLARAPGVRARIIAV